MSISSCKVPDGVMMQLAGSTSKKAWFLVTFGNVMRYVLRYHVTIRRDTIERGKWERCKPYGYPPVKLAHAEERGKLQLGGCVVEEDSPQ